MQPSRTASSAIISAKFARPLLRQGFIERPGLMAQLEESLEGRVTLVSAPAGFGKSTLIAQWLEAPNRPPSAWLSLDQLDYDVERFLRHLVAAVNQFAPGALLHTEALLSSRELPTTAHLAESLSEGLETLEEPGILVLDDFEEARAEALHALIRHLVHRLPGSLHLVILSRVDPPLPLNLWRSRHWLRQLRGTDLHFSIEESRQFFEKAGSPSISDEALEILHRKTEGWITGLRLVSLMLADAPDPEARARAFSGTERLILEYLTEQVLAAQPEEVRQFLALTAPLERFCDSLCDHLLTRFGRSPVGRRILERLYRDNLFLVPLGELSGWYRYHPLFRQLLLDRFDDLAPMASQSEISRLAGEWFAREGLIEEGLQHLLAADDLEGAADLFGKHLHEIIDRDLSRRALSRWLTLFPPGAQRELLPLAVASLYLMIQRRDFESMLESLTFLESDSLQSEGERKSRWKRDFQSDLDVLSAYAQFWSGDVEKAVAHAERARAANSDLDGYRYSLALVYGLTSLFLTGRRDEYRKQLSDQLTREKAAGGGQLGPLVVAQGCCHLYGGELDACRAAARSLLRASAGAGVPEYWLGVAQFLLGSVACERNRLSEAEAHFHDAETMRLDMPRPFVHHVLLGLARVSLARGDQEKARHWRSRARDYAVEMGSPTALRDSEWWDRQFEPEAGAIEYPPPGIHDFVWLSLDTPFQCWARLQIGGADPGRAEAALPSIDAALARAEAHGVELRAIQLSVSRAVALDRLGRRREAVEALEHTVRRAHAPIRTLLPRWRVHRARTAEGGLGTGPEQRLRQAVDRSVQWRDRSGRG